jgi:hypothetical protein
MVRCAEIPFVIKRLVKFIGNLRTMNTSHRSESRVDLSLTAWIMFQNFTVTKHNDLSFDNDTKC